MKRSSTTVRASPHVPTRLPYSPHLTDETTTPLHQPHLPRLGSLRIILSLARGACHVPMTCRLRATCATYRDRVPPDVPRDAWAGKGHDSVGALSADGEVVASILPKPGRIVLFDSRVRHSVTWMPLCAPRTPPPHAYQHARTNARTHIHAHRRAAAHRVCTRPSGPPALRPQARPPQKVFLARRFTIAMKLQCTPTVPPLHLTNATYMKIEGELRKKYNTAEGRVPGSEVPRYELKPHGDQGHGEL